VTGWLDLTVAGKTMLEGAAAWGGIWRGLPASGYHRPEADRHRPAAVSL